MKVNISYGTSSCKVLVSGDSSLTEVAFGVESAVIHFLGRGVSRFDCSRRRHGDGSCELDMTALMPSGPMVLSRVATVGSATAQGFFPKSLAADKLFQVEETASRTAGDGQYRHGGGVASTSQKGLEATAVTILESHELRPDLPFTVVAYGLADTFTALFSLDVKYLKWQGSAALAQTYFRHGLSDSRLKQLLRADQSYDPDSKASSLNS